MSKHKKEKLALFDIDGTLVLFKGLKHRAAFMHALKEVYCLMQPDMKQIEDENWMKYNGKPDSAILLDLAESHGIPDKLAREMLPKAINAMIKSYIDAKDNSELTKGVKELIDELLKNEVSLGLVTGNIEDIGRTKLKNAGLDPALFPIGGFGNEAEDRADLVKNAVEKAESHYKKSFDKNNIFIFGDARRDIEAGKKNGVKVIALATGKISVEELIKEEPFAVFPDLTYKEEILNKMGIN